MAGVSPVPTYHLLLKSRAGAIRQSRGKRVFIFSSIHVKIICMQELAVFGV
jgi:hypothetical protein